MSKDGSASFASPESSDRFEVPDGYVRVSSLADLKSLPARRVTIDGKDIALFLHGRSVYALDAVCPHQGGRLELGEIEDLGTANGPCILCPNHGWSFELRTGFCEDIQDFGVNTYATMLLEDGGVCVAVAPSEQSPRGE
eukprot:gnl/MRDRNA2_/MRDRNA2_61266_c0_seq1.p1 gnl/MRDRNA2_/MRDRNA2_61266_c0~~gnl/MRDRNA2_/MRDRNA2_61266_c0_seq1.p1  ORF type:complete len:157 (-),score=29.42 gnl/MRDRNA2_/MRDRNA2_61266_c0_seq1:92-508(-)